METGQGPTIGSHFVLTTLKLPSGSGFGQSDQGSSAGPGLPCHQSSRPAYKRPHISVWMSPQLQVGRGLTVGLSFRVVCASGPGVWGATRLHSQKSSSHAFPAGTDGRPELGRCELPRWE